MRFVLRDQNGALVAAWKECFSGATDVEISQGDIFGVSADAIVSPANSFGFMDGGIDLVYSRRFGWGLQDRLRDLLQAEHDGELPVGQAVVVPTGDAEIPFLVSAPTMRVPMDVSQTVNAYLAFRAAIRALKLHNSETDSPIASVLCPGLGTAVGKMAPEVCARQMHSAYVACHLGQTWKHINLGSAVDDHYHMVG